MTQLADQTPGFHKHSIFTTTFDRNPWPADDDSPNTVNAVAGLEIDYGLYITEEGYRVATVCVPLLDELQQRLNKTFDKQLDPLYRATCTVTKEGLTRVTVQFHHSQLISFISSIRLDVKNVFDVEFTPEVGMTTTGALYGYNPNVRGMKGERHRITGESSSAKNFFNNMRAQVSHALVPYSRPDTSDPPAIPERLPAAITKKLYGEQENDITDLINLIGYDDQDVHNASQGIIHDMMFYHMNEDDRKNFTSRSKPRDLPSGLADGLAQELKDFLHDKYAPAYLCRSFAASEHYESKFTDKERKKLWYWWEGNGDKCLSRSKEYNNLNNLASIQAMKELHGPVLNQFLADGPDGWAGRMLSALQTEPIMDYYMANPIHEKQNRINKQCCIMNTLSPLAKTADEWSGNIMIYAHKVSLEYPCIKEDNETAEKWLRESLTSLIVSTISDDKNVPSGVRGELLDDIKKFEDANSLDQSNSAKQRAAAIIDKQSAAIDEAKTWITGVEKDVDSAWIGTRLYQWLGKAWESIYDKVSGIIEGSKVLKGLYTSAMASLFIGLSMYKCVGLIQDWNTLDDAKRSQVILETLKAVNSGVEKAIEFWKVWKGRIQSVNLDQVDVAAIDQGIYRALDENGNSILSMADEVNGEGGWHQSVAEHVSGDGVSTSVEEGEDWNQALDKPLNDIPAGGAKTVEEFSLTTKVLRGLNVILGLGVAVAMTFSLIRDWDHLDTKNKIISTLVLVTQVLTVILDLTNFGAIVGLWTVTGALGAALPIIGAVLVVIGIILALISYLVNLFWPPSPPPPDPVEEYISNHGKPLIDGFTDAPDPKLSYDISTDKVSAGSTTSITITAINKTSSAVSLTDARVTLLSGDDDSCLFSDPNPIVLVSADDPSRDTSGHVYVAPADEGDGTLPPPTELGYESQYFEYGLQVAGKKDDKENLLQKLVLQAGKSVKTVWTAKVSSKTGRSNVDVVENWGDDKSHVQIPIHRV